MNPSFFCRLARPRSEVQKYKNWEITRSACMKMSTGTFTAPSQSPPTAADKRYKSVRATQRGLLRARTDPSGTLDLQFQAMTRYDGRAVPVGIWRAGPLRTCGTVLDALIRSLSLLGEDSSHEHALRLSGHIDEQLFLRLKQYFMLREGCYEQLISSVRFLNDAGEGSQPQVSIPISWAAAHVAWTATGLHEGKARMHPGRETFVLRRRFRTWELWIRMENANSGDLPSRSHAYLCCTDLLGEEPALAAELLLFAALSHSKNGATQLSPCKPVLIPPERLKLISDRLETARTIRRSA